MNDRPPSERDPAPEGPTEAWPAATPDTTPARGAPGQPLTPTRLEEQEISVAPAAAPPAAWEIELSAACGVRNAAKRGAALKATLGPLWTEMAAGRRPAGEVVAVLEREASPEVAGEIAALLPVRGALDFAARGDGALLTWVARSAAQVGDPRTLARLASEAPARAAQIAAGGAASALVVAARAVAILNPDAAAALHAANRGPAGTEPTRRAGTDDLGLILEAAREVRGWPPAVRSLVHRRIWTGRHADADPEAKAGLARCLTLVGADSPTRRLLRSLDRQPPPEPRPPVAAGPAPARERRRVSPRASGSHDSTGRRFSPAWFLLVLIPLGLKVWRRCSDDRSEEVLRSLREHRERYPTVFFPSRPLTAAMQRELEALSVLEQRGMPLTSAQRSRLAQLRARRDAHPSPERPGTRDPVPEDPEPDNPEPDESDAGEGEGED